MVDRAALEVLGAVLTGRAVEHGSARREVAATRLGRRGQLLVRLAGRKRFVAAARVRVAGTSR